MAALVARCTFMGPDWSWTSSGGRTSRRRPPVRSRAGRARRLRPGAGHRPVGRGPRR
jgi:hypothetical protein